MHTIYPDNKINTACSDDFLHLHFIFSLNNKIMMNEFS